LIEIRNINKRFGDRQVVDDVSFTFLDGKTNLIIGESGCGKTTIVKLIVGLYTLDSGDVFFDGKNFGELSAQEQQEVRKKIGMLFQGGALFDSLTLEENVRFPMDMFTDLSLEEKLDKVNFCLNRVRLEGKNKLYPSELSGGMKKRAALARAIANNPRYLFCDEPNSGLDPKTAIVIDELIREITVEFNTTTIVVTHDMNSVLEIGDSVMFVYEGKNWWTGSKTGVLESGNKELDSFVFASEFVRSMYRGNG
jgi:phospholipid/cholesterol/gamma-HCH transport system ATP-binding protein